MLEKLELRVKELESTLVQIAANHAATHGALQEAKTILEMAKEACKGECSAPAIEPQE